MKTAVKSVFLIDDHKAFRKGLRMMLEVTPGLKVVGETSSHADLLSLVTTTCPDLLFIDVHLREGNCFALTSTIHDVFPGIRIVLMSMFAEPGYKQDGILAGASAVIFKPSIGDDISCLLHILYPGEWVPGS